MDERMLNVEADVNQLKGAYDHLATKADLAVLEGKLAAAESRLMMRLGGLIIVATGIIVAAMRLWQ
jgi:hypothetical protein